MRKVCALSNITHTHTHSLSVMGEEFTELFECQKYFINLNLLSYL